MRVPVCDIWECFDANDVYDEIQLRKVWQCSFFLLLSMDYSLLGVGSVQSGDGGVGKGMPFWNVVRVNKQTPTIMAVKHLAFTFRQCCCWEVGVKYKACGCKDEECDWWAGWLAHVMNACRINRMTIWLPSVGWIHGLPSSIDNQHWHTVIACLINLKTWKNRFSETGAYGDDKEYENRQFHWWCVTNWIVVPAIKERYKLEFFKKNMNWKKNEMFS